LAFTNEYLETILKRRR